MTDMVETLINADDAQRRLLDFAYDVVSGRFAEEEIRRHYQLTVADYTALVAREDVAAEMHKLKRMLDDHGAAMRWRIIQGAHRQIDVLTHISEDPEVPTNTRVKACAMLLEFGALRKREDTPVAVVVPIQIVTPMQMDLKPLDPFAIELRPVDDALDLL